MTDADKLVFDRRLFLRGLTLTSAGLVVPKAIISVPKPKMWSNVLTDGAISEEALEDSCDDIVYLFSMPLHPDAVRAFFVAT
jgi:hypothetical protein